jgi:hypothetical protein
MDGSVASTKAKGKGRPRIDDRGQVLAHFGAQMALGKSVSEIARHPLIIMGYKRSPGGNHLVLTVLRRLRGPTLERRYWQLRAEIDQSIARTTSSPMMINARYIGVRAPMAPVSFPKVAGLKPGRPWKNRTR